MITAKQAEKRMQEIGAKLDAYDFGDTWVVVYHEDQSFSMYRNAFVVKEDGWTYIFKEHGSPEYLGEDSDAVMLNRMDASASSVNGIDLRRRLNDRAPVARPRSFSPLPVDPYENGRCWK